MIVGGFSRWQISEVGEFGCLTGTFFLAAAAQQYAEAGAGVGDLHVF
jgi:hypothetical protein